MHHCSSRGRLKRQKLSEYMTTVKKQTKLKSNTWLWHDGKYYAPTRNCIRGLSTTDCRNLHPFSHRSNSEVDQRCWCWQDLTCILCCICSLVQWCWNQSSVQAKYAPHTFYGKAKDLPYTSTTKPNVELIKYDAPLIFPSVRTKRHKLWKTVSHQVQKVHKRMWCMTKWFNNYNRWFKKRTHVPFVLSCQSNG